MEVVVMLVLLVVAAVLYFIPSLVAGHRDHPNGTAIFFLNLLAGWTFLGWLVALIWALTSAPAASRVEVERRRPCPHCAEPILPAAKICPHCRSSLTSAPPARIHSDRLTG